MAGPEGVPTSPEPGFFARVYALVREVPRGRVVTYGEVAGLLGLPRGARAVGWALRALPGELEGLVPWHRVLGRGWRITLPPAAGGQEQARRLRAEGHAVRGGRILRAAGRCPAPRRAARQRPRPGAARTHSRRQARGAASSRAPGPAPGPRDGAQDPGLGDPPLRDRVPPGRRASTHRRQ